MASLSVICRDDWVLGGDFNTVRSLNEKSGTARMTTSMQMFDSVINELELHDPPLHNARFIWSNFRESPICYRLDRFLISVGWGSFYPFYRQKALPRITSCHCPIVLDMEESKWGPCPFRFKNI